VQVPEKGNISRPEQLVGKNIVTSFTNLSEQYFARLESPEKTAETNGATPKPSKTAIKYVGGSVEAACALGVADGIVDLVGMHDGVINLVKLLANKRQNLAKQCA
jgi:ATP phosphoribosyltransferase